MSSPQPPLNVLDPASPFAIPATRAEEIEAAGPRGLVERFLIANTRGEVRSRLGPAGELPPIPKGQAEQTLDTALFGAQTGSTNLGAAVLGAAVGALSGFAQGAVDRPPSIFKKVEFLEQLAPFETFEEFRSEVPLSIRQKAARKLGKFGGFLQANALTKFQISSLLTPEFSGLPFPAPVPRPEFAPPPAGPGLSLPRPPAGVPPPGPRIAPPAPPRTGGGFFRREDFRMPFINTSPAFIAGGPTLGRLGGSLLGGIGGAIRRAGDFIRREFPGIIGGAIGGGAVQVAIEGGGRMPPQIISPVAQPGGAPTTRAPLASGVVCPSIFNVGSMAQARVTPVNRFEVQHPVTGRTIFYHRVIPTGFKLAGRRRRSCRPR